MKQRRSVRVMFASALSALLSIPLALAPASPAHAASCYDGAVTWYATGSSKNALLPSASGTYKTTSRCNDINFDVRTYSGSSSYKSFLVRVCFVGAGYCNTWKTYDINKHGWMVIASNVVDNTTFRVELHFPEATHGTNFGGFVAF